MKVTFTNTLRASPRYGGFEPPSCDYISHTKGGITARSFVFSPQSGEHAGLILKLKGREIICSRRRLPGVSGWEDLTRRAKKGVQGATDWFVTGNRPRQNVSG